MSNYCGCDVPGGVSWLILVILSLTYGADWILKIENNILMYLVVVAVIIFLLVYPFAFHNIWIKIFNG